MKAKNSAHDMPDKNKHVDLEHVNRKRKLQNEILKKMVEHLTEQEKEISLKSKKK